MKNVDCYRKVPRAARLLGLIRNPGLHAPARRHGKKSGAKKRSSHFVAAHFESPCGRTWPTGDSVTRGRGTGFCRGLLLLGSVSLGTGTVNADGLSAWPDTSPPGLPVQLPARLSDDPSMGTNHTGGGFDIGMEQGYGGAGGISRIAKAYLNYTFLNRHTGSFGHNLQGRVGIANQSAHRLDSPLWPSNHFRVGLDDPINGHADDISDYRIDNGFLASLEWRLDAPGFADRLAFDDLTWGEVLQISFFADYGKAFSTSSASPGGAGGTSVDAMSMDVSKRGLSGAGVGTGLRFSLPGRLTANLKAAYSLHSWEPTGLTTNGGPDPDENRARYWFDFSYNF